MPDGGLLTVRSGADGDGEVQVEIGDTGAGIPASELGKIFEPFYTTKPSGQGTGLGLSIAYGIAQDHRGRIEVSSTVGEGSVFRLVLPRVGAEVT
jgi:signal transduction histidine kinase